MTIIELMKSMKKGTKFFVTAKDDNETFTFLITCLLLRTSFPRTEFVEAEVIGKDQILIHMDIPIPVLKAWVKESFKLGEEEERQ